ncbi:MAG: hypothetical protein JSV49_11815 [Thermoplasmata archaeon]|nr:MAG: hypothetical protein JSV49_11815 [Thermoplasmata archaeon]
MLSNRNKRILVCALVIIMAIMLVTAAMPGAFGAQKKKPKKKYKMYEQMGDKNYREAMGLLKEELRALDENQGDLSDDIYVYLAIANKAYAVAKYRADLELVDKPMQLEKVLERLDAKIAKCVYMMTAVETVEKLAKMIVRLNVIAASPNTSDHCADKISDAIDYIDAAITDILNGDDPKDNLLQAILLLKYVADTACPYLAGVLHPIIAVLTDIYFMY